MPTSIRSYSKVNLGLAIGPVRPDGFHSLTTVYQTLALHDLVTVEARDARATSISLTSSDSRVPQDASNTAWRMVEAALAELRRPAEVRIHIEKHLPVRGGLGAGSANAVAALLALEQELDFKLAEPSRMRLAAEIGSDVPLFLLGGTVFGTGRGELVSALPETPSMPCVLALPEIGISTAQAFHDWDALHPASSLTQPPPSATIEALSRSVGVAFDEPRSSGVFPRREGRAETPLLALVRTGIENDFEQVVFPQYPFLGEIKRVFLGGPEVKEGTIYAALSGSGSALFGLYPSGAAAEAALARLQVHGIAGVLTRTLPRDEYWRSMRF